MSITEKLPTLIYAEAVIHSNQSIVNVDKPITTDMLADFAPDPSLVQSAIEQLRQSNFEVYPDPSTSTKTITIAATPEVYERVFRIKLTTILQKDDSGQITRKIVRHTSDQQWIDTSTTHLKQFLEGVLLSDPISHFATNPSPFPPPTSKWCLHVPGDVAIAMKAALAHRTGFTGKGVKVVMVDTGWYPHPFFSRHGYQSKVVLAPGAQETDYEGGMAFQDKSGHGTGESANLFAIAPDIDFTMVKHDAHYVNMTAALKTAISLKPDIISCSWGESFRFLPTTATQEGRDALARIRSYELILAEAVRQGIVLVFSAGNLSQQEGNRGQWAFPGQHPDVISAGGAFMYPDESVIATQFASGFVSNIYPNRVVPDVCGLVGLPSSFEPSLGGLYIMLPVQPGCDLDKWLATRNQSAPMTDETRPDDGWAVFSGTSAAAPQIAGVCALMKQACPQLSPSQVKDILKGTARDVTMGRSAPMVSSPAGGIGYQAGPGPDVATGFGLADANRAALMARLYYLAETSSLPAEILTLVKSFKEEKKLSKENWQRLEKERL